MSGTSVATDLTAAGKVGVVIRAAYDFWSPARHYQVFHDHVIRRRQPYSGWAKALLERQDYPIGLWHTGMAENL